jgi:small-conductance mechanosensitive channel
MDLVFTVVLLSVAAVLYVLVLLVSRMPDQPGWATELVMNDIANTVITGIAAFAIGYGTRFVLSLSQQVVGVKEIALIATTLVGCFVVIRLLAPRRRLAQYAGELARRNAAKEPALVTASTMPPAGGNGPSGKPALPRAA